MTSQIHQRLSAVAGMVASPLSPVAKAAQNHVAGLIKTKSRLESQAAIRKAVVEQGRDTRQPKNKSNHGKHIWLYKMRKTNRIIYSLTSVIDNDKALAQLTYVGKKSVPAVIRPDVWNPFAIITFPTATQGLEAYRFLREFRMRHEHEWRQHLDDQVNLPNKKKRMRMLQNQKPNSVADLAATLELQRRLFKEDFETRLEQLRQQEEKYQALLKPLQEIEAKIADLKQQPDGKEEFQVLEVERRTLKTPAFAELSRHHIAAQRALEAAGSEATEQGLSTSSATEGAQSPHDAFVQRRQLELIPGFISEQHNYRPLPKRGPTRARMLLELVPARSKIYALDGVKITWADGNDRNYAESWPKEVEHEVMGELRGTAPNPEVLRRNAAWRERSTELLSMFENREQELTSRTVAQWQQGTEEVDDFVQYMIVRRQLVQQSHAKRLYALRKATKKGRRPARELLPILLELRAASFGVASIERIAKDVKSGNLLETRGEAKGSLTQPQQQHQARAREAHAMRALRHELTSQEDLVKAASLRRQAQSIRKEAALEADLATGQYSWTGEMEEQLKALERAELDAAAELTQAQRGTPNAIDYIAAWPARLDLSQRARKADGQWLIRTLEAKRDGGSNLSPEEEEMLKNVELDGESSGKNEEELDESEEKSDGSADPQAHEEDLKKQEKRQQEEKKSLWGKLFSGSSPSSKGDEPRL